MAGALLKINERYSPWRSGIKLTTKREQNASN